jgi:hypothetical protein
MSREGSSFSKSRGSKVEKLFASYFPEGGKTEKVF